jgi:hypothetical protein
VGVKSRAEQLIIQNKTIQNDIDVGTDSKMEISGRS